jgi:hypothetical protein
MFYHTVRYRQQHLVRVHEYTHPLEIYRRNIGLSTAASRLVASLYLFQLNIYYLSDVYANGQNLLLLR